MQMDAAGLLFMALLSVYFASPTSPHMPYPWPSAVYATCQHLLPLMIMAGCMPWCEDNVWHLSSSAESIDACAHLCPACFHGHIPLMPLSH